MQFLKLNKDLKLLLILFTGCIIAASCETKGPNCYQPVVASMVAAYQLRDTQINVDTVTLNPLVIINDTQIVFRDSLMGSAEMRTLDEDTIVLIKGIKDASTLGVPFDQARDSIRYTFRTDSTSTVYDTLTFHYSSSLHFISNNCGYTYFFNIDRVTHTTNMIDSVSYPNRNVTDDNSKNVLFYFKKQF